MGKKSNFTITVLLVLTLVFGNILPVKAATTSYYAPNGATWKYKSGWVSPSQIQYTKVVYYTHAQLGNIVAGRLSGPGTSIIKFVIGSVIGKYTPYGWFYSIYSVLMATNTELDNAIIKNAYKRNLGLVYYIGYKYDAKGKCFDYKAYGYTAWTNAPRATLLSAKLKGSFSAGIK